MIALLIGVVIAACVIEVCSINTFPERSTSVLTADYNNHNRCTISLPWGRDISVCASSNTARHFFLIKNDCIKRKIMRIVPYNSGLCYLSLVELQTTKTSLFETLTTSWYNMSRAASSDHKLYYEINSYATRKRLDSFTAVTPYIILIDKVKSFGNVIITVITWNLW